MFRDAEPSPHINRQIERTRRFAPVDVSQSLIVRHEEQAFSNCCSDLKPSVVGIDQWQCIKYRWVWIRFQHAGKLLQSISTSSRYLSQCLIHFNSCQYPRDVVGLEMSFLHQRQ